MRAVLLSSVVARPVKTLCQQQSSRRERAKHLQVNGNQARSLVAAGTSVWCVAMCFVSVVCKARLFCSV